MKKSPKFSILIVSFERKSELFLTLNYLKECSEVAASEVLVLLDGFTDNLNEYKSSYPWVNWVSSPTRLGASISRNKLYKLACGDIFIGLDDDANPLDKNFLNVVSNCFKQNPKYGILAFYELKVKDLPLVMEIPEINYEVNEFVGCGFAIKKSVYQKTNGFPVWMDIYGEEKALATEVINLGFIIHYTSSIIIHHRVDLLNRKKLGYDISRFNKSLLNQSRYILIYYPPLDSIFSIFKLYYHNLLKYGLKHRKYFYSWSKIFALFFITIPIYIRYRTPITRKTLLMMRTMSSPKF